MNEKHTPLPWELCQIEETDEVLVSASDPRPGAHIKHKAITVCEMYSLVELRLQDAELIVRAVNAIDELVASCKELLECHMGQIDPKSNLLGIMDRANAAIAKATQTPATTRNPPDILLGVHRPGDLRTGDG